MKSKHEQAVDYIHSLPKCDICGGNFAYRPIIDKDTGKVKIICTACHMEMTFANGFVKYASVEEHNKEESMDKRDYIYNFNEIIEKVLRSKLAAHVKFTYSDKRNIMELKFIEGITISIDLDLFGYGALQKYTNTYTNFYDERTDFIIDRMRENPEFKLKAEHLSIFPNNSAIILFEDDPILECYNMQIWCGIKRTEYRFSSKDIDAMYDRYMKVIKRYSSITPGHIYFIDARKKHDYEDLKYYI